jgi:hypothetical protein
MNILYFIVVIFFFFPITLAFAYTKPSNPGTFQVVIPVIMEDNIFGLKPDLVIHNWTKEMNFYMPEHSFG